MEITKDDVGRQVWSVINGWGEIMDVDDTISVDIKFKGMKNDARLDYYNDGKSHRMDKYPELYWDEMVLTKKKLPPQQAMILLHTGDFMITEHRFGSRDEFDERFAGLCEDERPKFIRFINPENP